MALPSTTPDSILRCSITHVYIPNLTELQTMNKHIKQQENIYYY